MKIVVDITPQGHEHFIETDPAKYHPVGDPSAPGTMIDIVTLLTRMNGNVAMQQAGGWLVVSQLPGEPAPLTRWARMLKAVNSLPATDPLRALNLA